MSTTTVTSDTRFYTEAVSIYVRGRGSTTFHTVYERAASEDGADVAISDHRRAIDAEKEARRLNRRQAMYEARQEGSPS